MKRLAIMLLLATSISYADTATTKATTEVATARTSLKVARDHLKAAKAAERADHRAKTKARAIERERARLAKLLAKEQVTTDPADY